MLKRKRKLFIGIFVLILFGLGLFFFTKSPKKLNIEVQKVQLSDMDVTVSASGVVDAEKDETITFQTSGLLAWVGVKENDPVKKWQAIASLDKKSLEKQFQKTMNNYMTNRWDFEQTQDNYKQTKENKLVTDAIQRILDKYQFSLNNAVLDVEISDLVVKFATIYAPFDGIVVSASPKYSGVNVTPASASYRIVDPKSIYFNIQVDETDVSKIKTGSEVKIKLDAYKDQDFLGYINNINFNSTITSGGGTAYRVFVTLPENVDNIFRLGMNGDALIVTKKLEKVIIVPISALLEKNGKSYIWKVENNKAVRKEVVVGVSNENSLQIESGINEGDTIISSGVSLVTEGMKISN